MMFPILAMALLTLGPGIKAQESSAEQAADHIIVIGLDSTGKAKSFAIPRKKFHENMTIALAAVQESVLTPLSNQAPSKPGGLELRTLGVGLGLSGQFGLGPLLNITLSPRIRFIFTNSTQPTYPD